MTIEEQLKQADAKVQKAYHEGILKGWVKSKTLVINEKVMRDTLEGFGFKVAYLTILAHILQGALFIWLAFLGPFWTYMIATVIAVVLAGIVFYWLVRRTARVKNVYKLIKVVDKDK